MVKWKRTMAVVLGGLLVLSQGMVSMAEEDMTEGVGSDAVASESAMCCRQRHRGRTGRDYGHGLRGGSWLFR